MANYKGHIVGGIAAFALGISLANNLVCTTPTTVLQWLLLTLAGSLFPDIDTKSKGQYYFYWLVLIALLFLVINNRWAAASFLGIFACSPLIVRHRGIFHRFWFIVGLVCAVSLAIALYTNVVAHALILNAVFFLLGVFSHLVLDVGFSRALRW